MSVVVWDIASNSSYAGYQSSKEGVWSLMGGPQVLYIIPRAYNTESKELKSLCAICQLDKIWIHATASFTYQIELVRGELGVHWSVHTLYVPCFVAEAQVKTAAMTRLRTGDQAVPWYIQLACGYRVPRTFECRKAVPNDWKKHVVAAEPR